MNDMRRLPEGTMDIGGARAWGEIAKDGFGFWGNFGKILGSTLACRAGAKDRAAALESIAGD